MSNSSSLNVYTVLWQSPDGKPFLYRTSPLGSPREVRPRRFEVSEVQKYKAVMARHLPEASFHCLSNVEIPGVDVIPLEHPELIAWWAKMEMFRPGLPKGRNVYFDLDTLPLHGIRSIAHYPAPFACIPGMSGFERAGGRPWQDQEGKWRVPKYQTSCIVWDTSESARIWDRFQAGRQDYLERLASDQDFLGEQFPGEAVMPRRWFSKLNAVKGRPRPDCRVVLTMMAHNDGAARQYSWANTAWNG